MNSISKLTAYATVFLSIVAFTAACGGGGSSPDIGGNPETTPIQAELSFTSLESTSPSRFGLFVSNASGSGIRTVDISSSVVGGPTQPQLSPDGLQIAYIRAVSDSGPLDLFVQDMGKDFPPPMPLNLTKDLALNRQVLDFKWSPDGSRLAIRVEYLGSPAGDIRLYASNTPLDSAGISSDDLVGKYVGNYAWSPDGDRIAFTAVNSLEVFDFTTQPPSTNPIQLDSADNPNYVFSWSPPGTQTQLGYIPPTEDTFFLWKPDGSTLSASSALFYDMEDFNWSYDGSQIAFIATSDRSLNYFLVASLSDGSFDIDQIGIPTVNNYKWSPTDLKIAYSANLASFPFLFCVSNEVSNENNYCFGGYALYGDFFEWSPSGDTVAFVQSPLTTEPYAGNLYSVSPGSSVSPYLLAQGSSSNVLTNSSWSKRPDREVQELYTKPGSMIWNVGWH